MGDAPTKVSFTDCKPRVVDDYWLGLNWSGQGRERFRCYLCGHRFELGDTFRFQFVSGPYTNLFTCEACDGSDVAERWKAFNDEIKAKGYQLVPLGVRYD